jgi:hypothetical protein
VPKRTFWLVTGAALGAGTSLWAERKLRRSVQQAAARLQPDTLVAEVGRSARQAAGTAGGRVRDAVASGRDEMQRREEELWADLSSQGVARDPVAQPALEPTAGSMGSVERSRLTRRRSRRVAVPPTSSGRSRSKLPLHLGN